MTIGVSVVRAPLMTQIMDQVKLMLDCVDYCNGIPTVHKWLHAIVERFDVLLGGRIRERLDLVFHKCLKMASIYSQYCSTAPSAASPLSQRAKAHGFFCLALVAVDTLPLDVVAPPDIDALEWEQMYFESQCNGTTAACLMRTEERQQMCEVLEFTTACSFAQLQEDTYATALELRSAMVRAASRDEASTERGEYRSDVI